MHAKNIKCAKDRFSTNGIGKGEYPQRNMLLYTWFIPQTKINSK